MLKRLLVGLIIGLVVGGGVAAVLSQALNIYFLGTAGALFAYLFAALTGVLTGLVAGKPIWSATGKIEAGLKAFFGALISMGIMFALRKWATLSMDLSAIRAGVGELGELPATSLPLIGAVLGGFFEADNTPEPEEGKAKDKAGAAAKVRVAGSQGAKAEELEDEEEDASEKRAKRK
jgi:hypothetical protein